MKHNDKSPVISSKNWCSKNRFAPLAELQENNIGTVSDEVSKLQMLDVNENNAVYCDMNVCTKNNKASNIDINQIECTEKTTRHRVVFPKKARGVLPPARVPNFGCKSTWWAKIQITMVGHLTKHGTAPKEVSE